MGQMTYGIMYGVEAPENLDLFDEVNGLLPSWERSCRAEVKALAERRSISHWDARARFVPEATDAPTTVGFWIAVGASGSPGCAFLESVALGAVRSVYAKEYKRARLRWRRFAKWSAANGLVLPKPRLWLAELEVA